MDDSNKNTQSRLYNLTKERVKQKLYDKNQYARPEGGLQRQNRDLNASLQIQRNIEHAQTAQVNSLEQYAELTQVAQTEKEKQKEEQKKIRLPIFLVILFLCVVGDIIDALTGGTLGWLIGILIDLILVGMTLPIKSLRAQTKDNIGTIIGAIGGETVPFLGFLPFRTALVIYLFIISRSKLAQTAVDIKGKFKGKSLARKTA